MVEASSTVDVESEQSFSVVAAFMIDLFGTFLCQVAFLLMKVSHRNSDKTQQSAVCSCTYFAAMVCLAIGNIIHVVVLPFCPIVLLAMNSSTAIIMTSTMAILFLEEQIVWRYDLMAFLLISIGTTGIVLMSHSTETALSTAEIESQITSMKTIGFCIFYIVFVVSNYMLSRWFRGQLRLFERQGEIWANR